MSLFSKRETITQNIAYLGIMTAVNVIAVILMTYVLPILFLPFVLILPLASTIVTLFCKKKYYPIYFIATTAICLLITLNNFTDTILYIVPSLLSGFIFGIMIENRFPNIITIFLSSIIYMLVSYVAIPLVNFIYGQNMIEVISTLFGIKDFKYLDFVIPTFLLIIGLIQATLSLAIIIKELPKLGIEQEEKQFVLFHQLLGLLGSILSLVFAFVFPSFSYFFMIFAVFFGSYEVALHAYKKAFKLLIVDGATVILFIFIFAILYQYVKAPYTLLLFNILFDGFILTGLVNLTLTKITKSVE